MDKEDAINNHRRMWLWLAEDPNNNKWDWPEWGYNGSGIPQMLNDCFCCKYDLMIAREKSIGVCSHCPPCVARRVL
jgi:hypothetical protein